MIPEEQRAYLMNYGKHFNEKMYRFAVSLMRDTKGNKLTPMKKEDVEAKTAKKKLSNKERLELIESLTAQMKEAAKMLEFEHAAFLRDQIKKLKGIK